MSVATTPNAFADEASATRQFESEGCAVLAGDFPANELGLHWHDFAYKAFVVDATLLITDVHGTAYQCGPGTLLEMPLGDLHAEQNSAGRFLFGFPAGEIPDISVNRDPNDHPDRKGNA